MTRQSIGLFLILGAFSLTFFIPQTGCNSVDERYFERLDSLKNTINQTEELLNIDYQTIQNRRDLINQHMLLVNRFVKDSFTIEFGNALSKYKGIRKVYDKFLKEYESCMDEQKYAEEQADDLTLAVKDGQLSRDSFKVYYAQEMQAAETNLYKAQELIKPIHSVEPDYQRISSMVDEKLEAIAKNEPELEAILRESKKSIEKQETP